MSDVPTPTGVFSLPCDRGLLQVAFFSERVVHCAFFPDNRARPLPQWGICARPAPDLNPVLRMDELQATLSTSVLRLVANLADGTITIGTIAGDVVLEGLGYEFEPALVSGESTFHVSAVFGALPGERYYGLGQNQLGRLDHGGHTVPVVHSYHGETGEGESIGVPFLVTNRRYGFIFDNPSRTQVTLGVNGRTKWTADVGEAVSFFVIYGETTDEIYAGYRLLTGETPLPPKKALGYIQCKQRYASQAELLEVARGYRMRGYPCDMLVVDWFHWRSLGDLDLDPVHWPDSRAMNRELAELGYDVMISVWPRFMRASAHYDELDRAGLLMKDAAGLTVNGIPSDQRGAVIDTTHPEARAWYWGKIAANYAAKGFTSWWTDENEPDVCPHPFFFHAGTGARLHNLYPLTHSQAVYEGHRRDLPGRCLILSRSAYLGAQRYGTTFWSSDIYPTWDFFRRQIPTGLNFCASGFAYWSSDIGGWQDLPKDRDTPAAANALLSASQQTAAPQAETLSATRRLLLDPEDARAVIGPNDDYPELYVRWFQYGAFCPTFRAHGTRPENEVWSYGRAAEPILLKFLRLRYRLIPYIYSLAYSTRQTGAPFMRALFMDFPGDPAAADIRDQYMFGPAFLVAPVTEQGAETRRVYLPAGSAWYDYWTDSLHQGGQTILVAAPIDTLPLFVRAGSIIPCGEDVCHLGGSPQMVSFLVYPGRDARFDYYADDGKTYAYERGDFEHSTLRWDDAASQLSADNYAPSMIDNDSRLRVVVKHPASR